MRRFPSHTSGWLRRRGSALLMVVVYLAVSLGPLAPLAMHSKAVAHALTGECVGDCAVCGCSKESSADRTCCCARKRQLQAGLTAATEHLRERPAGKPDCCTKKDSGPGREQAARGRTQDPSGSSAVYMCGCPCGKGKTAVTASPSTDILPAPLAARIEPSAVPTRHAYPVSRPASRHGEPPDHPPESV